MPEQSVNIIMCRSISSGHNNVSNVEHRDKAWTNVLKVCRSASRQSRGGGGGSFSKASWPISLFISFHLSVYDVYFTDNWHGITFPAFLNCAENSAWNRQVRMLGDPYRYGCSHTDERMLETAKQRLRTMAFFGLMEYQVETRTLFERTFGVNFTHTFAERLNSATSATSNITASDLNRIRQHNHLDIKLYRYAKELFLERL